MTSCHPRFCAVMREAKFDRPNNCNESRDERRKLMERNVIDA